ncbi:MAG: 3-dehydroquinate dehydratase [Methanosaeta sp. PtaB.Bin018]|jgi:3-dehydroquinate dehydratase-1|nr:type I 3-dehydroquinate dehydratase [Methanothrix sp.]OPX74615.1 MAG: 3-dehydroquinate dehydratase [Methanosaeta sp. PtaB.Bin018]OPY47628.1 MAG: 3-dehydroquinate dehydratase [Methanosaeta sp. PtaU1.Bin016]
MMLKPRLVAVLGEDAARDVMAAGDADMVEVRLDLIAGDPLETIKTVRALTSQAIIATNRMQAEGGQFKGSEEDRLELLLQAADFADFIDIELHSDARSKLMKRAEKPVIVSYHNFVCTPAQKELQKIRDEMKCCGAAIAKIAVTPTSLKDNVNILNFLLENDMPTCVIAMGPLGRHLRAIAPIYGSALAYGYIAEPTAPGQMSMTELGQALRLLDPTHFH